MPPGVSGVLEVGQGCSRGHLAGWGTWQQPERPRQPERGGAERLDGTSWALSPAAEPGGVPSSGPWRQRWGRAVVGRGRRRRRTRGGGPGDLHSGQGGASSQQVNRKARVYASGGAKPLHFNYKMCVHIHSLVPRGPSARREEPARRGCGLGAAGQAVAAGGSRSRGGEGTPRTGRSGGAYAGETWLVETEEVSVLPADVSSSPSGFLPQQRVVIMQLRNWKRRERGVRRVDTRTALAEGLLGNPTTAREVPWWSLLPACLPLPAPACRSVDTAPAPPPRQAWLVSDRMNYRLQDLCNTLDELHSCPPARQSKISWKPTPLPVHRYPEVPWLTVTCHKAKDKEGACPASCRIPVCS